ncbi:hypothetical protein L3V86_02065 [Thiotrichales bacterium 19S11-10]|nr:hypothetical protein [Thiotrichales bacterium 19S11-10]
MKNLDEKVEILTTLINSPGSLGFTYFGNRPDYFYVKFIDEQSKIDAFHRVFTNEALSIGNEHFSNYTVNTQYVAIKFKKEDWLEAHDKIKLTNQQKTSKDNSTQWGLIGAIQSCMQVFYEFHKTPINQSDKIDYET